MAIVNDARTAPIVPWNSTGQKTGGGNAYTDLSFSNSGANGNDITNLGVRRLGSKYSTSKLRGMVEISEGQTPAQSFYPDPKLPTAFIDVELRDPIVIPKGTLVSSGSALKVSQKIANVDIDDFFRYGGQDTNSLLVPANGAWNDGLGAPADAYHYYSDHDVEFTVQQDDLGQAAIASTAVQNPYDGSVEEAAFKALKIPGNKPIGMIYQDSFMDLRGKMLNWEPMNAARGIRCKYYIEVFYINSSAIMKLNGGLLGGNAILGAPDFADAATINNYQNVRKFTAFSYGALEPGDLIQPDITGQYIKYQGKDLSQVVGKVIGMDFRYPKDMLGYVETYPGSEMPGTETGGLPSSIYWPASILKDAAGNQLYTTVDAMVTAVQNGEIGMTRIMLNI